MVNALTSKFFSLGIVVLLLCGVFWVCELPVTAAYGGDPDQWRYEMDDYAWQAGVSSYGTYIFTADSDNVYCFDTTDNSLVWQRSLSPSIIEMTPKVYEDILLVNIDPTIIGLNYTTGETIFTYTHSQDLDGGANKRGKPILVGNSLILRDYNTISGCGTIFVIDITDNSTIWSYNTVIDGFDFTRADSNIVYSNDVVYFCLKTYINGISNSGMVMARNATTGEHIWNTTTSEGYSYYADMWNDGAIDEEEGILYFSSTTTMYAFDITDGSIIWFFDDRTAARSSSIYIQPVIYGNDVFFSLGSIEMLFSANKLTGVSNWNFSLESEISSTPIISEDRIFVGSNSGLYFCLDSSTGETLWIFDGEWGAETESAIASGNVYFYDDYYLYGFDLVLGPKTFSLTVGENIEKVLFFDDFEDGISPYWYDIEEAALSDEAFEGEKGLFAANWYGLYTYFTPIFDSTNKNFTLTYCNKVSTDTSDLEVETYLEGSLFYDFEPSWSEDDTFIEFSIDFNLWNYFEHRYFYLGKIDGEWAVSEDSGDFLTSLNSDLIDNWMNYTFVFEVNEIDTNILVYLNSTFIGSVDVPVTSINFCGVSLSAPGYYDYVSIIQNTYDAGTYLENVWNDEPLVFRSTDPDFTGWFVNGEFVSSDRIYTLDVVSSFVTLEARSSSGGASVSPSPYVLPTSSVDFWFHASTVTFAGDSGYGALVSLPNVAASVSVSASGSVSASWGVRAWVVFDDRSVELTGGVPVSLGSISGVDSGLLSYSLGFPSVLLSFNDCVFKVVVYNRFEGDWSASAVFLSEPLAYRYLVGGPVVFNVFAERFEDGGNTYAVTRWGNSVYASGFSGVLFKTSTGTDWQNYYLGTGNFLMFLASPYTFMIGNLFYGLVLLGVGLSVYFRYRNISTVLIFITVLASAGGVGNILFGDAFAGVVWLVAAFALGLAYWRVFR